MADFLITLLQALQLVALAPCIFVIAFLLLASRNLRQSAIPILYFLTLACSFFLPLLTLYPERITFWRGVFMIGESLNLPLSFLLIMQFLLGRLPPPFYWLVLAVPLVGGSAFVYGAINADNVCLGEAVCMSADSVRVLYNIFTAAFVFLLLVINFSRIESGMDKKDPQRLNKYWLLIALIMLNLILLMLDLAHLTGSVEEKDALLVATVIRITFIYLVLTSLFRVYDRLVEIDMARLPDLTTAKPALTNREKSKIKELEELMEQKKLYREMGLSRADAAAKIDMGEHTLSRIINTYHHKNFNEYVNGYRVAEAKYRLRNEDASITVIAFEVGFASIASFNRVFKDMAGCSPSEFRSREATLEAGG